MGVSFAEAEKSLEPALKMLFPYPRVRSVGIGSHGNAFGLHVVRNTAQILPLSVSLGPPALDVHGVPVSYRDRQTDVEPHLKLPSAGPGSPGLASLVPEQKRHRPLVCGLQIENLDDDTRTGTIAAGHIIIGTLGCFVRLPNGSDGFLSNNHVVAGENRGVKGADRIMQQGTGAFAAADLAGTLSNFVAVRPSPLGATPALGTAILNDIDAGVVQLAAGAGHRQAYLPSRALSTLSGTAVAAVHDRVFKVGRTTGLTHGTVTSVTTVVGPVPYAPGPCWFRRSITIEGVNGTTFSDHGDSGSAVVKEGTGEVLGLLYAGNGTDTYVCPIADVLTELGCTLL
jgi:hypothetical protein